MGHFELELINLCLYYIFIQWQVYESCGSEQAQNLSSQKVVKSKIQF